MNVNFFYEICSYLHILTAAGRMMGKIYTFTPSASTDKSTYFSYKDDDCCEIINFSVVLIDQTIKIRSNYQLMYEGITEGTEEECFNIFIKILNEFPQSTQSFFTGILTEIQEAPLFQHYHPIFWKSSNFLSDYPYPYYSSDMDFLEELVRDQERKNTYTLFRERGAVAFRTNDQIPKKAEACKMYPKPELEILSLGEREDLYEGTTPIPLNLFVFDERWMKLFPRFISDPSKYSPSPFPMMPMSDLKEMIPGNIYLSLQCSDVVGLEGKWWEKGEEEGIWIEKISKIEHTINPTCI